MIEEIVPVPASHVRASVADLTMPEPNKVYVIERHEQPILLLWPCGGLTSDEEMRVKLTWAIKARNAFANTEAVMPLSPTTWPQTTLRRNATDIYLHVATRPTPGLITHYGRNVAIYVPVRSQADVRTWVETMNRLLR